MEEITIQPRLGPHFPHSKLSTSEISKLVMKIKIHTHQRICLCVHTSYLMQCQLDI